MALVALAKKRIAEHKSVHFDVVGDKQLLDCLEASLHRKFP